MWNLPFLSTSYTPMPSNQTQGTPLHSNQTQGTPLHSNQTQRTPLHSNQTQGTTAEPYKPSHKPLHHNSRGGFCKFGQSLGLYFIKGLFPKRTHPQ